MVVLDLLRTSWQCGKHLFMIVEQVMRDGRHLDKKGRAVENNVTSGERVITNINEMLKSNLDAVFLESSKRKLQDKTVKKFLNDQVVAMFFRLVEVDIHGMINVFNSLGQRRVESFWRFIP